jgi:peptidoglycan/LPS O-acetylase OafA/YrhL
MKRVLTAFSVPRNFKLLLFRPSTNLSTVDGFRALSMLMILAFHSFAVFAVLNPNIITLPELVEQSGWTWAWVWNSDKSVDIFLTISGYLITTILLRQIDAIGHIRMGNFYFRRFLRLTPVYYVAIGIYVLINGPNIENIWANMLYVSNFLPYDEQAMNWTWSLAIEEQFYLLYPLLLGLAMKHSQRPVFWLWAAFGLSFVICFVVIMTDEAAPWSLIRLRMPITSACFMTTSIPVMAR